jgi:hypothetical protein
MSARDVFGAGRILELGVVALVAEISGKHRRNAELVFEE